MRYQYKAKCSQCGRRFSSNSRSELLGKLRAHMWRKHAEWMRRRIKAGLRKRKQVGENPAWLLPLLAGVTTAAQITALVSAFMGKPRIERAALRARIASQAIQAIATV